MVVFEEYDGNSDKLLGYNLITGHLLFYIKRGGKFRKKSIFCADRHKTEVQSQETYSTVVSHDSVRIIITIETLNGFDLSGSDAKNKLLSAPDKDIVWFKSGKNFGAM